MAGILVMTFLPVNVFQSPAKDPRILAYLQSHPRNDRISGQIYRRTDNGSCLYLRNAYLQMQSETVSLECVKVYLADDAPLWPVGAWVLVTGKLTPVTPAGNPGQFDSVLYYETQHIYTRMFQASVEMIDAPVFSYREFLAELRERFCASITASAGDCAPVYQAMLFGEKGQLEDATRDRYQMAGILHVLTISGLHLSLLGMGCMRLLLRIGVPAPPAGAVSVLLLFSYGILTGEGVATMRALCMLVITIGARVFYRTYDLPSALALSAILLLLDSPKYLFYSGFLLSYGCVLGLCLIYPRLTAILRPVKHKKNRQRLHTLLDTLTVSLSIFLATLPLTMYFFFEVPVYGIVLNLLIIPGLGLVLFSGLAGAFAGLFLPAAATAALLPGNLMLHLYDDLGALAQRLPMTTWVAGQPALWQCILYYLLLAVLLLTLGSKTAQNKSLRFRLPALCCGAGLLLVTAGFRRAPAFSLTCLDVGQGDCMVVETDEGHHYLVDGGSSNISQVGRYRILPYLKSQGISCIDYAWVSHSDEDHINGIMELLELQAAHRTCVHLNCLLLPVWETPDENYQALVQMAGEAGVEIAYIRQGDTLTDGALTWQALWPESGAMEDINENSEVLLLTYETFRGLLTGDIDTDIEERIRHLLPDIDFLKVAHHGSRYSTGESFLAAARPEIAVISCSKSNTYGHPHPETLDRLKEAGCDIRITMTDGAVTVTPDGVSAWLD